MTATVQEPSIIRYFNHFDTAIRCSSTKIPIEPSECVCCSGFGCLHHEGARLRLWNDVKKRPWHYADKPWVFELSPAMRKLRRQLKI